MNAASYNLASLLIELGSIVVGLAVLGRIAKRWSLSSIPLYLLAGLAFGAGGILPLNLSKSFIEVGAHIGILLLLLMLGLEYTGEELKQSLSTAVPAGMVDFVLNFSPGVIAGLALGWHPLAAVLMGGVTWISSSGVIAKSLSELERMSCPETPVVLSVLVIEDLAMALYLPLISVLLLGGSSQKVAVSISLAVIAVAVVMLVAIRYGPALSKFVEHESDEIVVLTTFGVVLLVAGLAQRLQVSSAIGAFLVGIALSGPIAKQSHRVLAPLRDLFAATFFFFFGLEINPAALVSVLFIASVLGAITAVTKILTGYWAAARFQTDRHARRRAGLALVARGEFSIIIAGLGTAVEPTLGPLSAAYVLLMAIAGTILMRLEP